MKHHVTVGVDRSPESRAAARWGAREAALRQVPLRLVHAVDWPDAPLIPRPGRETADRWADEVLTDALEDVRRRYPQVEITTRCLSGRPAAALAAEAADAGLLVLGSRGLGGLVGFLIGSVSLSTLVATETPVALVRVTDEPDESGPAPFGEIVVGVDIHEAADRVLSFAFEEADRRGCALRAVHGWKLPAAYAYVPFLDPDSEREISRGVTQMLDDMLLPWRHKFPAVSVTHNAFRGSAGHQLVQAAAGADLVVVGRHLRRSPLGAHLGPVAHAVLHHAAAPVAVIAH
ncbi:universal stress protein [Streptomyces sp. APSN-46.1]|uniref:universal stress protein n=1 Tax=Streptomyces sp. APSN-46.1 TaxID=2929049 RepID=UPI001FB1CFEA|nr:universal stress protein [Streptomyces sp. APSN-46.1]MCJ1676965.1 universal stress protein [Streptomyces sp. APSN-46.1]